MKQWTGLLGVVVGLLLSACGGGGEGGVDPQPLGVFSLNSAGGTGGLQSGYGGNGGWITAVKEGGSGDLAITRQGAVDASFTASSISVSLGSNPLIIPADTVNTSSITSLTAAMADTVVKLF